MHANALVAFTLEVDRGTAADAGRAWRARQREGDDWQEYLKEVKKERYADEHHDNDIAAHYAAREISPDFSLELTGFFPGKHSIHFLVLKMKDFRNFVLDNLTLNKFT